MYMNYNEMHQTFWNSLTLIDHIFGIKSPIDLKQKALKSRWWLSCTPDQHPNSQKYSRVNYFLEPEETEITRAGTLGLKDERANKQAKRELPCQVFNTNVLAFCHSIHESTYQRANCRSWFSDGMICQGLLQTTQLNRIKSTIIIAPFIYKLSIRPP